MIWDTWIAGIIFWGGIFGTIYYQSFKPELKDWWDRRG